MVHATLKAEEDERWRFQTAYAKGARTGNAGGHEGRWEGTARIEVDTE